MSISQEQSVEVASKGPLCTRHGMSSLAKNRLRVGGKNPYPCLTCGKCQRLLSVGVGSAPLLISEDGGCSELSCNCWLCAPKVESCFLHGWCGWSRPPQMAHPKSFVLPIYEGQSGTSLMTWKVMEIAQLPYI